MLSSLVQLHGQYESRSCGYCHASSTTNPHVSWGMTSARLTVSDYEYLINRGWRRSGFFCYKPMNDQTCCPCYPIRCEALSFRPTRSQKRCLVRLWQFLHSGVKTTVRGGGGGSGDACETFLDPSSVNCVNLKSVLLNDGVKSVQSASSLPNNANKTRAKVPVVNPRVTLASGDCLRAPSAILDCNTTTSQNVACGGDGVKMSRKQRRWATKQRRLVERSERERRSLVDLTKEYQTRRQARLDKNKPKVLEDLLPSPFYGRLGEEKDAHYIELRLVRSSPPSRAFRATLRQEFDIYARYQRQVHNDPHDFPQFIRFLVDSPLIPNTGYTSDQLAQLTQENDKADWSWTDTTCPPLPGSYHQQYWLDGKQLIAVGVIDLLPTCLSSVYLFYDPAFAFLQPGTLSALFEIALVRHLASASQSIVRPFPVQSDDDKVDDKSQLIYYYMGFFITSCPKMSYKARFRPAFLACPETHTWLPIDSCLACLSPPPLDHQSTASGDCIVTGRRKYARFSSSDCVDPDALEGNHDRDIMFAFDEPLIQMTYREWIKVLDNRPLPANPCRPTKRMVSLDWLKSRLRNHSMVDLVREWAVLVGQRAVDGCLQIHMT